jgi:hypothetical protein
MWKISEINSVERSFWGIYLGVSLTKLYVCVCLVIRYFQKQHTSVLESYTTVVTFPCGTRTSFWMSALHDFCIGKLENQSIKYFLIGENLL